MNLEKVIFDNLLNNETFARKTIPFLKSEYFETLPSKILFELIETYVGKYNAFPTKSALEIDLGNRTGINESAYNECANLIKEIPNQSSALDNEQWLLDNTEQWCQDRAIFNAISESIKILDSDAGSLSKGAIPQLMTDALAVSFDTSIGHDFLEDFESRFEFYHRTEERLSFDIDYFNKITKGGIPRKSLTVIMAPTGEGKSLFMCHMAAANLTQGKNVLYVTLEMAEEKIAERIDANLLDIPLDMLQQTPKSTYDKKILRLKEKAVGKLIIKEYPTSCAGSANFRHLLNELRIKKKFVPDIIYIDYLNICCSSRLKQNSNVNSYTYIKSIAEELRGLAVEFNVPIISATQVNRGGFNNSEIEITDTSESMGLPATVDLMFAIYSSEEMKQTNQVMVKQLKNRYSDPEKYKKFIIGIDKSRMRLYNLENSLNDASNETPVFDNTRSGETSFGEFKGSFDRGKLDGFK